MLYDSPAIARLGIPGYNWWNEALHGVARAGVATVFPQAINSHGHPASIPGQRLAHNLRMNSTTLELQLLKMVIAVSCVCV